jgi:hypothetical protein
MDNFSDFFWPMEIGLSEETPNNIISYHLAEDGIYCRKNVFADKYIVYKDDKVSDLPKIKENLHPIEDSKIPARLLRESLSFFKYINVHFNQWLEAYVIFGMDKSGKYFLYVPSQDVQHAHVHASIEEFYDAYPGCYIVCDIHSHCDFGAFWSGQDSADDIKGRYSVVAGHNAKVFPDIKCRFNYSGKYIDLEVDSLFEENDNYLSQDYDYKEWINKLNEHSEVVIVNMALKTMNGHITLSIQINMNFMVNTFIITKVRRIS